MSVVLVETVSGRIKKIQTELANVDKQIVLVLSDVRNDIQKRTQSGKDYKGTAFHPYNEQYKKFKKRSGRPDSPVNLTFRSHMLNGMTVGRVAGGGRIYFPDGKQRKKAGWHHNGEGHNPERPFFELSKQNMGYISKRLKEKLKKAVRA